jgi:pimeloyl-ACP methyl ester carboxylesterase
MDVVSHGTKIVYDDVGDGEPALLLMSGWCAPRTYYNHFVALSSLKRRCLVIDWPGHGDSELPKADFGEKELVDAAKEVIRKSGARRVVPVAAAHSGWVAIELRRELPETIQELVLPDWLVLQPPREFLEGLRGLQNPEQWKQIRDGLFAEWLAGIDNAKVSGYVRKEMGSFGYDMWSRAGREIAMSYNRFGSPLSALEKLGPSPPRVLHIYSIPKDDAFLKSQEVYSREHSWFSVE